MKREGDFETSRGAKAEQRPTLERSSVFQSVYVGNEPPSSRLKNQTELSLSNLFNTIVSYYFYVKIVRLPLTRSVTRLDRRTNRG